MSEEGLQGMFENRVLRSVFGCQGEEVTGLGKLYNE
jgi:hypothetical protein